MIKVLGEVKQLYKQDSVQKNYFLMFRDYGKLFNNTSICAESLSITESICSSGNFKVGLCEAANMRVKLSLETNVKDDEVAVFQALNDFDPTISYDEYGVHISGEGVTSLYSDNSFTVSDNVIYDSETFFEQNSYYLIFLKVNYIGKQLYFYMPSRSGIERMVYYMRSDLIGLNNLSDWESGQGYEYGDKVWYNNRAYQSIYNSGTNLDTPTANTWKDITKSINIAIPIIGNDMLANYLGLWSKDDYVTGSIDIYKIDVPLMPLGLFRITSCKKSSELFDITRPETVYDLEGYDRMIDEQLEESVTYTDTEETTVADVLDAAAIKSQIFVGNNRAKNLVTLSKLNEQIQTITIQNNHIYKVQHDDVVTIQGVLNKNKNTYTENQTMYAFNATKYEFGHYNPNDIQFDIISFIWPDYRQYKSDYRQYMNNFLSWEKNYSDDPYSNEFLPYRVHVDDIIPYDNVSWAQQQDANVYSLYQKGYIGVFLHSGAVRVNNVGTETIQGDAYDLDEHTHNYYTKTNDLSNDTVNVYIYIAYKYKKARPPIVNTEYDTEDYDSILGSEGWQFVSEESDYDYLSTESTEMVNNKQMPIAYRYNVNYSVPCYHTQVPAFSYTESWTQQLSHHFQFTENHSFTVQSVNYNTLTGTVQVASPKWEKVGTKRTYKRTIHYGFDWPDMPGWTVVSENYIPGKTSYGSCTRVYKRTIEDAVITETQLKEKTVSLGIPDYEVTDVIGYSMEVPAPADISEGLYNLENKIVKKIADNIVNANNGYFQINRQDDIRNLINQHSTTEIPEITAQVIDGVTYGVFDIKYVTDLVYTVNKLVDNVTLTDTIEVYSPSVAVYIEMADEMSLAYAITKNEGSVTATRRNVISAFLEISGLFINFDRYGVSTLRNVRAGTLYPALDIYPHDSTIPGLEDYGDLYPTVGSSEYYGNDDEGYAKSLTVEDVLNKDFDGICIVKASPSDDEASLYPFYYNRMDKIYGIIPSDMPLVGYYEGNNYYTIQDNFFINNYIFTETQLKAICQTLIDRIGSLHYFNLTAELRCLPYMEVGDSINIQTPSGGYETVILRRTMKGNLGQMDNYETDFYD